MKFCKMSLFYLIIGFDLLTTFLFVKENDFAEAAKLTNSKDVDFRETSKTKLIVDKTRFIPKLLTYFEERKRAENSNEDEQPQFIILRPYRFGKSFFLTTLAAFFEGKKDLFCNRPGKQMNICNYNEWVWDKYPILYLDFGLVDSGSLTDYIKTEVLDLAWKNDIVGINKEANFGSVMKCAFKSIQQKKKKKIVILVDEYDLPVAKKYFDDVANSKLREDDIEAFFHAVKNNAHYIQFAFVFGATKITTVGDTLDVFEDLTHEETFSNLIGFTEEEIKEYYKDQLEETARKRKLKNGDEVFKTIMKPYYNHYRFTQNGVLVFNPLSVTSFLRENPEKPKSFWGEKVPQRSLLQNTVKKFSKKALDIICEEAIPVNMNYLKEKISRQRIEDGNSKELAKILFQTGFMSIKEGEICPTSTLPSCSLGVVNDEARHILVESLREKMEDCPVTAQQMETLLRKHKLAEFMGALDNAVEWLTGDKFFVLETKYQRAIAFILESRILTVKGFRDAFWKSLVNTEYEIGTKFMDYKKELPDMTVMFYLKKQAQGENYVNLIEEMMRCLGTYAKPYGKKHKGEEVLYIIISAYAGTKEGESLENKLKHNPTGLRFIHNWAAFEWFPETETIKTYNLGLDDSDDRIKHRVEVITRYNEMDQQKIPPYLVPASFDPIADQIIEGYKEVISLKNFYEFIELCKAPATDVPNYVSRYTSKIEGLIELTEKCHEKVSYNNDRALYLRLKHIIEALKEIKLKGT